MRKTILILSIVTTIFSCSKNDSMSSSNSTGKCTFTYTTNNQTYSTGSDCLYVGWAINQEADSTEISIAANNTNVYSIVPFRISLFGTAILPTGVGTYNISTRHSDKAIETLDQIANERPNEWYVVSGKINVTVATQNNLQGTYTAKLQNIKEESLFKEVSGSVNLWQ